MLHFQAAICGEYCGKCPNYGIDCLGCTCKLHMDCYFVRCSVERQVEHCGVCKDFPCKQLRDFLPDNRPDSPRGYHIKNLRLRMAIGTEAWLKLQRDRYEN